MIVGPNYEGNECPSGRPSTNETNKENFWAAIIGGGRGFR